MDCILDCIPMLVGYCFCVTAEQYQKESHINQVIDDADVGAEDSVLLEKSKADRHKDDDAATAR